MADVSVVIPARNELWLRRTVEDVLRQALGDIEIIVIADGYDPGAMPDDPRVRVLRNPRPIGQRASVNQGARLARGKFVMKLDAHCAVGPGFDMALAEDCGADVTLVPAMWNLHVFDWQCQDCQLRSYQGSQPVRCVLCGGDRHEVVVVWRRRYRRCTTSWYFDRRLQFQYWHSRHQYGPVIETMSFLGACMFLRTERFWQLGGMDERHGSWGQFGTEWSCKTWLSGGRLLTSRKTWFAHLFRTGNFCANGESSWPYEISDHDIQAAREYSRDLWLHDRWPLAIRPLSWLVEHFRPVPDWHFKTAASDPPA